MIFSFQRRAADFAIFSHFYQFNRPTRANAVRHSPTTLR